MFNDFNTKFNAVAYEIRVIANQKLVSYHTFYKLGQMISHLPLKSIKTEQKLEHWVSNHKYNIAINYLKAQNR